MANKQHAQFSDENGNIYYLENQTEDVLDPSGKPLSDGGDLSEASVTFTADSTRTLPKSGSRFKAFCGSVLKFLSDLKTVSFSGSYNDLSNKPSIPSGAAASQAVANNCTTTAAGSVLDARQGKVLMDKANQLNSEIEDAKQELGGIEYGTVTVTSAVTADIKGVHKINKTAYLSLHGKTVTHALTSGIAHFQSSIPPASPVYIPYFIMGGASSRVQMAYMDQNGNISLAGGEDININEWFLFSTSYRTT